MIASGVIDRVLRILPTAQAATTREAIAKATASRTAGPVLPLASAATPSQIAARNPAEARPRTTPGAEYRTADTLLGHVELRNGALTSRSARGLCAYAVDARAGSARAFDVPSDMLRICAAESRVRDMIPGLTPLAVRYEVTRLGNRSRPRWSIDRAAAHGPMRRRSAGRRAPVPARLGSR